MNKNFYFSLGPKKFPWVRAMANSAINSSYSDCRSRRMMPFFFIFFHILKIWLSPHNWTALHGHAHIFYGITLPSLVSSSSSFYQLSFLFNSSERF